MSYYSNLILLMKLLLCVSLLIFTAQLRGQSTISSTNRFSHAANAGWIDFRPNAQDGVRVGDYFLSGWAHAANIGWIHFGNGAPANGFSYGNSDGADYGVNLNDIGRLTGFAYSPNIGWIQFSQTTGFPRLFSDNGSFFGSAYSANIGWISFEDGSVKTASIARTDTDNDNIDDAWEREQAGTDLSILSKNGDRDADGTSDLNEYLADTRPLSPSSFLKITHHSVQATQLGQRAFNNIRFTNSRRRSYEVLASTNLDFQSPETWSEKLSPKASDSGSASFFKPYRSNDFFIIRASLLSPTSN